MKEWRRGESNPHHHGNTEVTKTGQLETEVGQTSQQSGQAPEATPLTNPETRSPPGQQKPFSGHASATLLPHDFEDLARVVAAWPSLHSEARRAILEVLRAAKSS